MMNTLATSLKQIKIAFIGGGNMAQALIGGLLATGLPANHIMVSEPVASLHTKFSSRGISVTTNNTEAVAFADVVLLAVKPQLVAEVFAPLASVLADKLLISIAAGVSIAALSRILQGHIRIVRAMPNTPALVQLGATGLFAASNVSQADRDLATQILGVAGLVLWVNDEEDLHAVTAVSGSGPAYFFYLMEAMIEAGKSQGLDEKTARTLTLQTALGAAQMALTSDDKPSQLRENVTSKGGTTFAAISYLDEQQVKQHIINALDAAKQRSIALCQDFEQAL